MTLDGLAEASARTFRSDQSREPASFRIRSVERWLSLPRPQIARNLVSFVSGHMPMCEAADLCSRCSYIANGH